MPDTSSPFAAMLLAGGLSSRMGQDKALLSAQGKPLWQAQAAKLQALNPARLFISCREEQGLHQPPTPGLNAEWLFDAPGQGSGPMLPILQALKQTSLPLLVLAVDMPFMTSAFLRESVARRPDVCGFFFRTGEGIEPLAGIYTPAMLPLMEAAAAASHFSLRRLIDTAAEQELAIVLPLNPMDEALFTNANTPGEWRRVQA